MLERLMKRMKTIFIEFVDQINIIRLMFSGDYVVHTDKEMKKFEKDFYDVSIPTCENDKSNFKKDRSKVVGDFNKALEIKKKELLPHG